MGTNGSLVNDMDTADEKAFSSLIENSSMKSSTSEFTKEFLPNKDLTCEDTTFVCIFSLFFLFFILF